MLGVTKTMVSGWPAGSLLPRILIFVHVGGTPFPVLAHDASFPSGLADSLTNSLLNQPLPLTTQHLAFHAPSVEVKSRKENRGHQHAGHSPASAAGVAAASQEHQDIRRVSQQLYMPSESSISIGKANVKDHSPTLHYYNGSPKSFGNALQARHAMRDPSAETNDEETKQNREKGMKRIRNFTPASARVIDDEDEPRRLSPRARLTSFLDSHAPAGIKE